MKRYLSGGGILLQSGIVGTSDLTPGEYVFTLMGVTPNNPGIVCTFHGSKDQVYVYHISDQELEQLIAEPLRPLHKYRLTVALGEGVALRQTAGRYAVIQYPSGELLLQDTDIQSVYGYLMENDLLDKICKPKLVKLELIGDR